MSNQLIERLIRVMRSHLQRNETLAAVLINVLSLNKEAAYRRLRGDIMFTFEEAAKLSRRLGFSLDKIVGESLILDTNKWAFTDISTFHTSSEYVEGYARRLCAFSDMLRDLLKYPQATIRSALGHLPYYFVLFYPSLTLFRHYKRAYLAFGLNPEFRFSDFTMSPDIREKEQDVLEKCLSIPRNHLILERNVFHAIVEDINYFYHRKLISKEELLQLKKELLESLSNLENIAATGRFGPEMEVSIYLLDVRLDASYTHFESPDFEYSLQYSYFVDILSFYNPKVCQMQKNWIESLKRYSTMISQTGEIQRIEFFKKQREIIKSI